MHANIFAKNRKYICEIVRSWQGTDQEKSFMQRLEPLEFQPLLNIEKKLAQPLLNIWS